jgi:hypothetical protein
MKPSPYLVVWVPSASTAGSLGILGGLGSVEDVSSAIFAVLALRFTWPFKSPRAGCSPNFGSSMRTVVIQTVLVGQSVHYGVAHTTNSYPTDKFTN